MGVLPVLGARPALNDPSAPSFTLSDPAATACSLAVVNAGHEISSIPWAGAPSARYTVSIIWVSVICPTTVKPCTGCGRAAFMALSFVILSEARRMPSAAEPSASVILSVVRSPGRPNPVEEPALSLPKGPLPPVGTADPETRNLRLETSFPLPPRSVPAAAALFTVSQGATAPGHCSRAAARCSPPGEVAGGGPTSPATMPRGIQHATSTETSTEKNRPIGRLVVRIICASPFQAFSSSWILIASYWLLEAIS